MVERASVLIEPAPVGVIRRTGVVEDHGRIVVELAKELGALFGLCKTKGACPVRCQKMRKIRRGLSAMAAQVVGPRGLHGRADLHNTDGPRFGLCLQKPVDAPRVPGDAEPQNPDFRLVDHRKAARVTLTIIIFHRDHRKERAQTMGDPVTALSPVAAGGQRDGMDLTFHRGPS